MERFIPFQLQRDVLLADELDVMPGGMNEYFFREIVISPERR